MGEALKGQFMDMVIDIIRNLSPADTHYQAIKERLLSAFGLSTIERRKMLLDWPGMVDGTPSAFLSKKLAYIPAGENSEHILLKVLFLWKLPADSQHYLARSTSQTNCMLARKANA